MIHLANDPNAIRTGHRPAQHESQGRSFDHQRSRGGHAWPFLSRHAGRPVPQNTSSSPGSESIS
jgi:hypothetical protein